ncbi:MAG: signal peptidase II [Roseburia sp.]|nr:signal peptidase II [Roseburia sp.]MCM1098083.1 signal peptidase II [Ruminococcus flavefaciens]
MRKKALMSVIDFLVAAVLLAVDQLTKYWAVVRLKGEPAIVLIRDALELSYLENRGSAFGMLQNQKFFLLFVGCVFLLLILFFLFKLPTEKKFIPTHICLAAVVAGGIGNMIDRLRFDYVVDFISFVLIHFPVFNFADCCIVVAVAGLFILFLFVYQETDLEFLSFKQNKYRKLK